MIVKMNILFMVGLSEVNFKPKIWKISRKNLGSLNFCAKILLWFQNGSLSPSVMWVHDPQISPESS